MKKISIYKYWKHTVDRDSFSKDRQEGQDLEGSTQMLTIHFVRMFAHLITPSTVLTISSHPPHFIKYKMRFFTLLAPKFCV